MSDLLPIAAAGEVVQAGLQVWDAWGDSVDQFNAWQGGAANGGPNGDGRFPIKNRSGATNLVPCPQRMNGTYGANLGYTGELGADERLPWLPLLRDTTFKAGFAGSIAEVALGAPADTMTLTVEARQAGSISTIGTITIATSGAITLATTGNVDVTVSAGGAMRLHGPGAAVSGVIELILLLMGTQSL